MILRLPLDSILGARRLRFTAVKHQVSVYEGLTAADFTIDENFHFEGFAFDGRVFCRLTEMLSQIGTALERQMYNSYACCQI